MSEENVEIVRRAIDAWNRRNIEALHALGDPEGEYVRTEVLAFGTDKVQAARETAGLRE